MADDKAQTPASKITLDSQSNIAPFKNFNSETIDNNKKKKYYNDDNNNNNNNSNDEEYVEMEQILNDIDDPPNVKQTENKAINVSNGHNITTRTPSSPNSLKPRSVTESPQILVQDENKTIQQTDYRNAYRMSSMDKLKDIDKSDGVQETIQKNLKISNVGKISRENSLKISDAELFDDDDMNTLQITIPSKRVSGKFKAGISSELRKNSRGLAVFFFYFLSPSIHFSVVFFFCF